MQKRYWKRIGRKLKKSAPMPERLLKSILSELAIDFRFNHPVRIPKWHPIIVDFYLPKEKIVFEMDGDSHLTKEQIAYDIRRDLEMAKLGFKTYRFKNKEIINNRWPVYQKVRQILNLPLIIECLS